MAALPSRQIHWFTPAMMTGALLLGGLFALGHDLFYASLAGNSVEDGFYGLATAKVSKQQLNLAIGNTFAFLVKSSLVSSVSIAYFQAVWRAATNNKHDINIGNMDILLSALGNAISLASFSSWLKWPLLLFIAIIAWLIPIVSIITPATLSVGFASPPNASLHVPNVAFAGLSLVAMMPNNPEQDMYASSCSPRGIKCENSLSTYLYHGPSDAVKKVVAATAAEGAIIPVDPPASNSSWNLEFAAPVLRCHEVEGETRRQIELNFANYSSQNCLEAPGYVAWTPFNKKSESLLPFHYLPNSKRMAYSGGTPYKREGRAAWDVLTNASANSYDLSFFMAVVPRAMSLVSEGPYKTRFPCQSDRDEEMFDSSASVLRCNLHNATYDVDFRFTNGVQKVELRVKDVGEHPLDVLTSVWGINPDLDNASCTSLNMDRDCTFDVSVLRHLSYQAVMDAFTEMLVGYVTLLMRPDHSYGLEGNSTVRNTVLATVPELGFLRDISGLSDGWALLQNQGVGHDLYRGLWNGLEEQRTTPLNKTLEELFQNITISLMSSPHLQPNENSTFLPEKTEVAFSTIHPVYVYSRSRLWLAYGFGLGCSLLVVMTGMLLIYMNGVSLSNDFSTLLRLARGATLSSEIEETDLDGRDPLPKYIKEIKIKFRRSEDTSSEGLLSK